MLLPAARREIHYKEVGEIDFTLAQTKRKNLEVSIASGLEPSPLAASPPVREPRKVIPPSDAALETFFMDLAWVTQSLLCYRSCHRTVMDLFLSRHILSIRKCCTTYSETTTTSRHITLCWNTVRLSNWLSARSRSKQWNKLQELSRTVGCGHCSKPAE